MDWFIKALLFILANIVELFVQSEEDGFISFPVKLTLCCVKELLFKKPSVGLEGSFNKSAAEEVFMMGCFRTQAMAINRTMTPIMIPGIVIRKIT